MSHADEMQRFYDEVSAGRLSVIEELLTEDFVEHDPFAPAPTREGTRQFFEMSLAAFPDMRFAVSHMVGEGDLVMAFGNFEGTHKAEFMGIPATNRRIEVPFADVVRFGPDGRAVEHWGVADSGMMMRQLGVGEPPG